MACQRTVTLEASLVWVDRTWSGTATVGTVSLADMCNVSGSRFAGRGLGRLTYLQRRGHVQSVFLHVMPFFPLLFGLIQCGGTLIELRRSTFRSSVLEQLACRCFLPRCQFSFS